MPSKQSAARARRAGTSASSRAGEFVRDEIHRIRRGEHGARSAAQAIAIGLSKARRAGVKLPPGKRGRVSARSRRSERLAYEAGQGRRHPRRRPGASASTLRALRREPRSSASHAALSRQARGAAARRTSSERHNAAMKAVGTKGTAGRSASARKTARTRSRHGR